MSFTSYFTYQSTISIPTMVIQAPTYPVAALGPAIPFFVVLVVATAVVVVCEPLALVATLLFPFVLLVVVVGIAPDVAVTTEVSSRLSLALETRRG